MWAIILLLWMCYYAQAAPSILGSEISKANIIGSASTGNTRKTSTGNTRKTITNVIGSASTGNTRKTITNVIGSASTSNTRKIITNIINSSSTGSLSTRKNIAHPAWRQRNTGASADSLVPTQFMQPHRIAAIFNESDLKRRRVQASEELTWYNGPVMHDPAVYIIFYGSWSSTAKTIVTDFIDNLGGSPWYGTQTTYYDSAGYLDDSLYFSKTTNVYLDPSRSQGTTLNDDKIHLIVTDAIINGGLYADPTGVYLVLTDSATSYTDFCIKSCGFHGSFSEPTSGNTYVFGIISDPTICGADCGLRSVSPNGNPGVDAMLSVVAHEIVEAVSDPYTDLGGWYHSETGNENADTCNFDFGTNQYMTASGAVANFQLGMRDFYIQQNWVNGGTSPFANTCQTALPYLTLFIDNTVPHAASTAVSVSWTVNSAAVFPLTLLSVDYNAENIGQWSISKSVASTFTITLSSTPYGVDGKTTFVLCDFRFFCSNEIIVSSLVLSVDESGYVVAPSSIVSYSWSYAGVKNVATSPLVFKWYLNGNYYSTITKTTRSGTSSYTMPSVAGLYSYQMCDSNGACSTPVDVSVGTLSLSSTATTLGPGSKFPFSWSSSGGVTYPLTLSIWDYNTDSIFFGQYDVPSTASGTDFIQLPSFLWLGDYDMWLCDANWVCANPYHTLSITISLTLSGILSESPYAPGSAITYSYSSVGATLPLSMILLDYATDSFVYDSWFLPADSAQGSGTRTLSLSLIPGRYDIFICDNYVCGDYATITVGTLSITSINSTAFNAAGATIQISLTSTGMTKPFNFTLLDYDTNYIVYDTFSRNAISDSFTYTLPSSLLPEWYDLKVCDANTVCEYLTFVIGSLTLALSTTSSASIVPYSWSSTGATLPFNVQLLDSNSKVLLSWTPSLKVAVGADSFSLPTGLNSGIYRVTICDSGLFLCATSVSFYVNSTIQPIISQTTITAGTGQTDSNNSSSSLLVPLAIIGSILCVVVLAIAGFIYVRRNPSSCHCPGLERNISPPENDSKQQRTSSKASSSSSSSMRTPSQTGERKGVGVSIPSSGSITIRSNGDKRMDEGPNGRKSISPRSESPRATGSESRPSSLQTAQRSQERSSSPRTRDIDRDNGDPISSSSPVAAKRAASDRTLGDRSSSPRFIKVISDRSASPRASGSASEPSEVAIVVRTSSPSSPRRSNNDNTASSSRRDLNPNNAIIYHDV